jgi:hypothetical protein
MTTATSSPAYSSRYSTVRSGLLVILKNRTFYAARAAADHGFSDLPDVDVLDIVLTPTAGMDAQTQIEFHRTTEFQRIPAAGDYLAMKDGTSLDVLNAIVTPSHRIVVHRSQAIAGFHPNATTDTRARLATNSLLISTLPDAYTDALIAWDCQDRNVPDDHPTGTAPATAVADRSVGT